jgi:hypothetical protein
VSIPACRVITKAHLPDKGITYCNYYLLQLEGKGRFPKRIRLSERKVGWFEHEIDEWIAARAAERVSA